MHTSLVITEMIVLFAEIRFSLVCALNCRRDFGIHLGCISSCSGSAWDSQIQILDKWKGNGR